NKHDKPRNNYPEKRKKPPFLIKKRGFNHVNRRYLAGPRSLVLAHAREEAVTPRRQAFINSMTRSRHIPGCVVTFEFVAKLKLARIGKANRVEMKIDLACGRRNIERRRRGRNGAIDRH